LITAIEITPGSEQDGPVAALLVDQQPEGRRPERLVGDTAYGTGPVRGQLAEREVEVLAPVPGPPVREDRLAKRDFKIDPDAGRKLEIMPNEELLIAARQALDDPATTEHLRRTRPRIERLLGLSGSGRSPAKRGIRDSARRGICRRPRLGQPTRRGDGVCACSASGSGFRRCSRQDHACMRLSRHAKNEMRLYGIGPEDVEATIADPVARDVDDRGNARLAGETRTIGLSLL
jgi:hypothetical protein